METLSDQFSTLGIMSHRSRTTDLKIHMACLIAEHHRDRIRIPTFPRYREIEDELFKQIDNLHIDWQKFKNGDRATHGKVWQLLERLYGNAVRGCEAMDVMEVRMADCEGLDEMGLDVLTSRQGPMMKDVRVYMNAKVQEYVDSDLYGQAVVHFEEMGLEGLQTYEGISTQGGAVQERKDEMAKAKKKKGKKNFRNKHSGKNSNQDITSEESSNQTRDTTPPPKVALRAEAPEFKPRVGLVG